MDISGTRAVNRLRRITAALLSAAMVFTMSVGLTACGSGGVDSEIGKDIPDSEIVGNRVEAPVNTGFFTENNLKITDVEIENTPSYYEDSASLKQIEGLKNKEIQDSINSKIRETYTAMLNDTNPPPVRGSKLAVKEYLDADGNPQPSNMFIDCYAEANFENILSVKIWKSITFGDWDNTGESINYNDTKILNFDLNTGKELKLQDIFADNVDALKYVNRYTEKMLETTDYESEEEFAFTDQFQIKLTAPFKGFSEDIDFFINDYDGSLNIMLNSKTPEFYVGYGGNESTWIRIPYCEEMGYTEKFDSEECLFEDEEVTYTLIPHSLDESHKVRMNEIPDLSSLGDMIYYNKSLEYYDCQSKAFIDYAKEWYDGFETAESFKERISDYKKKNKGEISANRYLDCRTESMGKYEILHINYTDSVESVDADGNYSAIYNDAGTKYITFDSSKSKIMTLDDLFSDGVDVVETILKQMLAKRSEVDEWSGEDEKPYEWSEKTEEYLRAMIKSINGFSLNNNSITFSFDDNPEAMAADYIGCPPEELWNYAYLCNSEFLYKDLGNKNLTIFD